ncbi:oligosaccharide flippase family protein [Aurantiacibacter sp. D1-12]|uniref:oligosaccharide flippase family protein n=1 Tax=Aurantiacibacter sp. D1-12 TaxID=2993658 RepID=UPI00237CA860|nr:oligosaccharide flippase family protein [Aurantiacibacter sp. D1-12]MDE1467636.1 oligosaccharide flippase family protein [Aurantiacibacter sp. D1-12]
MAANEPDPLTSELPADGSEIRATKMSVRGAALLAMVSQMGAFTIQFAASVILARWFIDPDELGLFTIAFSFVSLLAVLQEFGITRYVNGEKDLSDGKIRTAFTVSITISWAIAIVCVALAWPVSTFYEMPELLPLMLVIAASYFFVPLAIVPMALAHRKLDFVSNTMTENGVVLANAVVAITLAWKGYGAMALAWGAFAQQVARMVISQWRVGFIMPFPPRYAGAMPILKFGGFNTVLSGLYQAGVRLPELLIGRLLDTAALGLFTRAFGLAAQLRLLVSGALASVFYPAFARLRDRGDAIGPQYERVTASYCAITWPAMAGLAACAVPIVSMLYGERWMGAARPLEWIAISQLLFIALPLHIDLPILLGRMKPLVWRCAWDTLASITLLVIGAWFSLEAAAASRVAYGVAWMAIHAPFLHRTVGFGWNAMLRIWAQSLLVTGLAVLPVWLSYLYWAPSSEAGFAQLLVAVGAGISLWLIGLRQIRHPAYGEIHGYASSALDRLGWRHWIPAPR